MKSIFRARAVCSCLIVLPLYFGSFKNAHAITYTWNGGSGDWTNTAMWTPTGMPGVGDTATIATVNSGPTVSTHITVTTVNVVNSAAIAINAGQTLTIVSAMNLSQINNISGGTLEITSTATLTTNNAANTANNLSVNLKNDGTVTCSTGFLNILQGVSTGTFNATAANAMITMPLVGGNTMIISNGALNGHFTVGGGGNSVLQIDKASLPFTGTIELYDFINGAGSMNLNAGGLINIRGPGFTRVPGINIPLNIAAGGTLHLISDAFNSSLSYSSNLVVDGTLQMDPDCTLDLSGSATTMVLNSAFALPGKIIGAGKTTLNAGKTITCSTSTGLTQIVSVFDNFGTVNVASGKLEIGNCTNEVGAALNASGANTEISLVQGGNQLTNSGAITGTLRIRNGYILQQNALNFTGNMILDNGYVLGGGSVVFNNPLTLGSQSGFSNNGIQVPATFPATSGVTIDSGRSLGFSTTNFVFDCNMVVNTGTLTIDASHSLTFNKALTLTTATLGGGGAFVLGSGGILSGTGTINGQLTSNGIVGPGFSPGTVTLNGSYIQNATGVLNLEIGGTSAGSFDQFLVNGSAKLDGMLNVSLVNGFVPSGSLELTVMKYQSVTGTWPTISLPVSTIGTLVQTPVDTRIDFGPKNAVAMITDLVPTSVPAGSSDFGLVVQGTNFLSSSTVQFNGQLRPSVTTSATELVVFLVAADLNFSGTASVVVINPAPGGGTSNTVQFTIGSGGSGGGQQLLTVKKAAIKLNFAAAGGDTIAFAGAINIPTGFVVTGQVVTVTVGSITKSFTLDDKGGASTAAGIVKIPVKTGKSGVDAQTSKFSVALAKGDYAAMLAANGLTNADLKKVPRNVTISLLFNGTKYTKTQSVVYSAKMNKSGSVK